MTKASANASAPPQGLQELSLALPPPPPQERQRVISGYVTKQPIYEGWGFWRTRFLTLDLTTGIFTFYKSWADSTNGQQKALGNVMLTSNMNVAEARGNIMVTDPVARQIVFKFFPTNLSGQRDLVAEGQVQEVHRWLRAIEVAIQNIGGA